MTLIVIRSQKSTKKEMVQRRQSRMNIGRRKTRQPTIEHSQSDLLNGWSGNSGVVFHVSLSRLGNWLLRHDPRSFDAMVGTTKNPKQKSSNNEIFLITESTYKHTWNSSMFSP